MQCHNVDFGIIVWLFQIFFLSLQPENKQLMIMVDKRQTLKNELSKIGKRRTFLRNTLRCRYISQHTLKECVYSNQLRLDSPLEGLDHYGRLRVHGEIDEDKYSIKINKELIKEWEKELRELTFKEKELNRELRKIKDNEK